MASEPSYTYEWNLRNSTIISCIASTVNEARENIIHALYNDTYTYDRIGKNAEKNVKNIKEIIDYVQETEPRIICYNVRIISIH
jgi:hypothetical protein